MNYTRRSLLFGAGAAMLPSFASAETAAEIAARLRPPQFPDQDFEITHFGARPGGMDCTDAIRRAVAAAAQKGGRVVVPAGVFYTGPVHLRSHVNLHIAAGATLRFSTDPSQYLPAVFTRWEGTECMGYSPLIYAFEQTNIAVTGAGTLDGQAGPNHWWPWKGNAKFGWKKGDPQQKEARDQLVAMADRDTPVKQRLFGQGSFLRPQFIQPYRCANVLIEGVRIVNSPMWELHPVLSKNVTVRNVSIDSHGPNNDGCDPESCSGVLIDGCTFNTGDDCIAIKSGRNQDGRRIGMPSEDIVVRGCTMKDGHGGVSIGSEVSGNVRNVHVLDCHMDSPHLERALRLKSNSYRGGVIESVSMSDTQIGEVAQAVLDIDFFYEEGEGGPFPPTVRNVTLENVTCRKSKRVLYLRGYQGDPIGAVTLKHCHFENAAEPDVIENAPMVSL